MVLQMLTSPSEEGFIWGRSMNYECFASKGNKVLFEGKSNNSKMMVVACTWLALEEPIQGAKFLHENKKRRKMI